MKPLFAAALMSASTLFGAVAASAQGLPPGSVPPQYGSQAWSSTRHMSAADDTRMADSNQANAGHMTMPRTAGHKADQSASSADGG